MAALQPSLECSCEVWNTSKCPAKALEFIQLRACKYILGCSVTPCDDLVGADLGLRTLRKRRVFRELKGCCEVMSMEDQKLAFKFYYRYSNDRELDMLTIETFSYEYSCY